MNIEDLRPGMSAELRKQAGAHVDAVLNPRPAAPAAPSDDAVRSALAKSPGEMTREDKDTLRAASTAFLRDSGRL